MDHNIKIVCYTGGACGDIVSALLDPRDAEITGSTVKHVPMRTRLKKPHMFSNDQQKHQYLLTVAQNYRSISSHDLEFHIRQKHKFISVKVDNWSTALWAAIRFKQIHKPHVWNEMQQHCGAHTVELYAQTIIDSGNLACQHSEYAVSLESIIDGSVVEVLQQWFDISQTAKEFYQLWLTAQ